MERSIRDRFSVAAVGAVLAGFVLYQFVQGDIETQKQRQIDVSHNTEINNVKGVILGIQNEDVVKTDLEAGYNNGIGVCGKYQKYRNILEYRKQRPSERYPEVTNLLNDVAEELATDFLTASYDVVKQGGPMPSCRLSVPTPVPLPYGTSSYKNSLEMSSILFQMRTEISSKVRSRFDWVLIRKLYVSELKKELGSLTYVYLKQKGGMHTDRSIVSLFDQGTIHGISAYELGIDMKTIAEIRATSKP